MYLKLFDINFPVIDETITTASAHDQGVDFLSINGQIDANDLNASLTLQARVNQTYVLECQLRFKITLQDDHYVPENGPLSHNTSPQHFRLVPLESKNPNLDIQLQIEGISHSIANFSPNNLIVVDNQLGVRFQNQITPDARPVRVNSHFQPAFAFLSQTPKIAFSTGFWSLETEVSFEQYDGDDDAYSPVYVARSEYLSDETIFNLSNASTQAELIFIPPRNEDGSYKNVEQEFYADPLDLEKDEFGTKDNPIILPVVARNNRFKVSLDSATPEGSIINALSILPLSEIELLQLQFRALGDNQNQPETWETNQEIPVLIRPETNRSPSTLLFGIVGENKTSQGLVKLKRQSLSKAFHAGLSGVEFFPDDEHGHADLMCNHMHHEDGDTYNNPKYHKSLLARHTTPWIKLKGNVQLHASKPGLSYRKVDHIDTLHKAENNVAVGSEIGIDILPRNQTVRQTQTYDGLIKDLNNVSKSLKLEVPLDDSGKRIEVKHASHMTEILEKDEDEPNIHELYRPQLNQDKTKNAQTVSQTQFAKFESHKIRRTFGSVEVTHQTTTESEVDYILITDDRDIVLRGGSFQLDRSSKNFVIESKPKKSDGFEILGLIKLSEYLSLGEILKDLSEEREPKLPKQIPLPRGLVNFSEAIDPSINSKAWTGLILFNTEVNFDEFSILKTLFGNTLVLKFPYIAIGGEIENDYDVTARLTWKNKKPKRPSKDDKYETYFQMLSLDATWRKHQLINFETNAECHFHTLFGIATAGGDKGVDLNIDGRLDKDTNEIRFLGASKNDLVLIDNPDSGPIKKLIFKSAEILRKESKTTLLLNGVIQPMTIPIKGKDWVASGNDEGIGFKKLGISIPDMGDSFKNLNIDYPSIKINLDMPHFSFFGIPQFKMKILNIGFSRDKEQHDTSSYLNVPSLSDGNFEFPALTLGLRMSLMDLPKALRRGMEKFVLDFDLSFSINKKTRQFTGDIDFKLKALGFNNLELDLLGFLTLSADRIKFGTKEIEGHEPFPWLAMENVDVSVLRKKLIDDLTLHIFCTPEGKTGFLGFLPKIVENDTLSIDWALVGNDIQIPKTLAEEIISVRNFGLGANERIAEKIKAAYDGNELIPLGNTPDDYVRIPGEWLFAAGMTIFGGVFSAKFIYQDNAYKGLAIDGTILRDWFGLDFAIGIMHIMRARPEEDSFFVSIRVPDVTVPMFSLQGGILEIEIFVNNSFILDAGYPRLMSNGAREWSRAFGTIVGFLQGSGGFYIVKRQTNSPDKNKEFMIVGVGYAAQGGVGATYGGGIFTVTVTAGIYYILEGLLLLEKRKNQLSLDGCRGMYLSGACGILVTGTGHLNYWIISVSIRVVASAEARVSLIWKHDPRLALPTSGTGGTSTPPTRLQLDFNLTARASARACIGRKWFRICKGVSVTVSMPFRQEIEL